MGFLVTTLIFVVVGIIASLCTRICCNRGPSTNLYASFSLSLQFIYLFFFLKKKHGMRVIQLNCCYCSFQKEEQRKVVTCKRLPYPFNWIVNAFPNADCFHRWFCWDWFSATNNNITEELCSEFILLYIFLVFLYQGLLNACDFLEHFLYRLSSSTWGLRRGILGLKLII
jgi:hypothetical protein